MSTLLHDPNNLPTTGDEFIPLNKEKTIWFRNLPFDLEIYKIPDDTDKTPEQLERDRMEAEEIRKMVEARGVEEEGEEIHVTNIKWEKPTMFYRPLHLRKPETGIALSE